MLEIAILIRTMYLLKHNCHNLVARDTFFQDHDFFSSSYKMSLDQYDSLIERMIGLLQKPNLLDIQIKAVNKLAQIPIAYRNNEECFTALLALNKILLAMIERTVKEINMTEGTKQMLGGIADAIEMEQYKINQRLKVGGNQ